MARLEAEQAKPAGGCADLRLVGYRRRSAPAGLVVAFASANADQVPANLNRRTDIAQGVSALGIVWEQ